MKKFDFVQYLDSGQMEADMQQAVTQAIQQAEAAGLPRAYCAEPADCVEAEAAQIPNTLEVPEPQEPSE